MIGRDPRNRKRMAVVAAHGRNAVTHYRMLERFAETALVRLRIETGRTHQIRVHLAHLGVPVVGDPLYGRPARDRHLPVLPARTMLHATKLAFAHPVTGKSLSFERPPHADMLALLDALRKTGK